MTDIDEIIIKESHYFGKTLSARVVFDLFGQKVANKKF